MGQIIEKLPDGRKRLTPLKAIKANCLDCSGGSYIQLKNCHLTNCPLWPYRFGKNPYLRLSDEEKKRRTAIILAASERKKAQGAAR
jgi:hypothetical protein